MIAIKKKLKIRKKKNQPKKKNQLKKKHNKKKNSQQSKRNKNLIENKKNKIKGIFPLILKINFIVFKNLLKIIREEREKQEKER